MSAPLTRGERAFIKHQLSGYITVAEMATFLNLIFPSEQISKDTPRTWELRRRRGAKPGFPVPAMHVGPTKRPLWQGETIVRWYAEAKGLRIPQWVVNAMGGGG